MDIGQSAIAGIIARARGRPRIGSVRCNVTVPDYIAQAVGERRRMTSETRNQAIIALIDAGMKQAKSQHFIDRQSAIVLLRSSVTARLKVTDDKESKRTALNALAALDGVEEYLGLRNEGAK